MRLFSAGHMLLLLTSIALFSSSLAANQANSPTDTTQQIQWLDAPELPIALQEIYPAVFEERIVVGGGFTPSKTPSFFGLGPSDKVFMILTLMGWVILGGLMLLGIYNDINRIILK